MKTLYEVIGHSISCPEENFSLGLYDTDEDAQECIRTEGENYDNCDFVVEVKFYYPKKV